MENSLWLAYCCFHNGDYKKAIGLYDSVMKVKDYDKMVHFILWQLACKINEYVGFRNGRIAVQAKMHYKDALFRAVVVGLSW